MLSLLSVPALALLISLPGLSGFHFPGFRVKSRSVAVQDSIPPTWKTASLLALRDDFVFGDVGLILRQAEGTGRIGFTSDERRFLIAVDPDSGEVTVLPQLGEVAIGAGTREGLTEYSHEMLRATFRKQWAERSRSNINSLGSNTPASSAPTTGLTFQLPGLLPKSVQSLLGPGSPALNVSGSENIRLSGESNWTNQQTGPLGQKRSLFPSLDMQQDLNIQLEGQLSDRIRVNLLQNSLNQIPLANRIAINYKGEEDDLIQQLDLGNTELSLPGTQYVSYSGRNEGLFGAKASSRFGPLDMTVLATKQEGRSERASYTGGASRQQYTIYSHEYVRGVYFFLYDPNFETLDIQDASIKVYRDDGNYNTTDITVRGRAFVDPRTYSAPNPAAVGDSSAAGQSLHGNFRQLLQGADQDYEVLQSFYGPRYKVLKMKQPLNYDQRLAVTYTAGHFNGLAAVGDYQPFGGDTIAASDGGRELRMRLIRAPLSSLARDDRGNFADSVGFTNVRHLELANFYQLPGQRIDASTFKLQIERGDDVPAKTFVNGPAGVAVPYLEVLGLDNYDETNGTPVLGHDNKVDGTAVTNTTFGQPVLWLDVDTGVLHFFEPRPFAPRLHAPFYFDSAAASVLNRRSVLDGDTSQPPVDERAPNPIIYDRYNPERQDDNYRLLVDFTAQSAAGDIQLGRGNILQGSEVVTVNGRPWLRDVDYSVDYDLGRVTLKKQLGPADNLNIDYSYAPLFQQAGRTLIGSAFQLDGGNKSLGGAFMYESRGAQDLRPRLGEEPSRSLIGDLNGKWAFTPDWMTRLADRLPGVRTTTPSEFDIEGEAGASLPNPNTRNEVFIDDMEGVRDAVSLTMGAERWKWSSEPTRKDTSGVLTPYDDLARYHNAEVHWYSPFAVVKERDLKPSLTDAEGAQNNRQVLAISVPRRPRSEDPTPPPGDPIPGDSLWVGLTYPLDPSGIDLSKSQFIELWVNDFNDEHTGVPEPRVRGHHLKLHVDLGAVSEDQQRAPDEPPNGQLDSEDKLPRDNQLVVTDANNEDTGYDGRLDAEERDSLKTPRDLTTATPEDPEGDDFSRPVDGLDEIDPRRFRGTNGTEGSKVIFPYPDTEDLNLNNAIDRNENYFEYTIDLGDPIQPYLITDVQRDFGARYPATVHSDNGWRRYRIPITDANRAVFGTPDLVNTRQMRVWLDGIRVTDDTTATAKTIRPLLMLGSIDIVGSRWRAETLSDSLLNEGSTVTLNSVNTVDNADIYKAPFNPGQTRSGNQAVALREQSLALEFTRLQPGMTLEAFKSLSLEEDYTRYRELNWYAAGFGIDDYDAATDTSLKYFVRFASDEVGHSYYEYRAPLPKSSHPDTIFWKQVLLKITDLSNLKLTVNPGSGIDTILAAGFAPGEELRVVGFPSFTRLHRISFGLVNTGPREYREGQLWFDELVSTDVEKTPGIAGRLLVNGKLANLMTYSASYNTRDANFVSVGETRGQGTTNNQFAFNTSIDTHRFFEGTGIVLPVSYGYSNNTSKPRFTAGDDIVRSGAYAAASQSRSDNTNWSVNYSRTWSERSNPLLLYTIGGITGGFNQQTSHTITPSSVDTSTSFNSFVNYRQSFRRLLAIPIPGLNHVKFFPLPDQVTWSFNQSSRESRTYDRLRDSTASLVQRNATHGNAAALSFGADVRPFDMFTYHIDGLRNLTLDDAVSEHLGRINIGRVVNFRQNTNLTYALTRGAFLRPSFGLATNYIQDNGPQISSDLNVRQVTSGQSYNVRWELPFETLTARAPVAVRDSSGHTKSELPWRLWLSRLGNVSAEGSYNKSSSYSRIFGTPDFFYLFGFADNPALGRHTSEAYGDQIGKNSDWRLAGRTRFNLGLGTFVTTQVEFTSRIGENNGVTQRNDSSRYPDLSFEYGKLVNVLRLDKFLVNPQLRTAYNRNTQTLFQNDAVTPTNVSTASQWQPLLGLRGALKNGSNLELSIERRNTQRENFQLGHSITNDRQTTVNFSLNRSYTQGQKLSLLGKTSTVRSSINMGVSATYDKRSGETTIFGSADQTGGVRNPTSNDRLSVQGNGSYGFSNNVTGTATLGFSQDRDLQRAIVRRSIRVEMRGSFTF